MDKYTKESLLLMVLMIVLLVFIVLCIDYSVNNLKNELKLLKVEYQKLGDIIESLEDTVDDIKIEIENLPK